VLLFLSVAVVPAVLDVPAVGYVYSSRPFCMLLAFLLLLANLPSNIQIAGIPAFSCFSASAGLLFEYLAEFLF
jgi:hypothetical protein